jgi:hypothetical protein
LEGTRRHDDCLVHQHVLVPRTATIDPAVEQFLQSEKDYILGEWALTKVLGSL